MIEASTTPMPTAKLGVEKLMPEEQRGRFEELIREVGAIRGRAHGLRML